MDENNASQTDGSSENGSKARTRGKWLRSRFRSLRPRPPDDDEPQDWWFASTAIPLIAATTGPIANVMSIVALVSPWRNNVEIDRLDRDGVPLQTGFRDPRWCTALNATSLACGVVGNLFLLFAFTRAVRYVIALPASIILWSMATGLLTGITAAMHVYQSPDPPGQTYSQAYWSAVIAAVLYFVLYSILMINMLGYFLGHYPQHFALTDDQRTLILQTMTFMVWLMVGAAVFQRVINVSFGEAMYFCIITILTLGFGDVTAQDMVARGLVLPYAVIGIIILGLVVGSIHRFGHELRHDKVLKKHIDRKRRSTVQASQISCKPRHQRKSVISAICALGRRAAVNRPRVPAMREEKDRFEAMRNIQRETMRFRRWSDLVASIVVYGIVWLVGAVVFWKLEAMTYFEAVYFSFCALLTIGYGDFTPKTNAGRSFFIVWSLFAIPTMTILISELSDTILAGFKQATSTVADWTVLPHSEKYRAFMLRCLHIFSFLRTPQANRHATQQSPPSPIRRERALASDSDIPPAEQLAIAIQKTGKDALKGRRKYYTYEEWVEFTRLFRFTASRQDETVLDEDEDEDEYGLLSWDWLGETSPMMAPQDEPEWVFDRLCESLMRYVIMQRR